MSRLLNSALLFGLGFGAAHLARRETAASDDEPAARPAARRNGGIVAPTAARAKALDPRFNKYLLGNAQIERLWTGARWMEGPVWLGDLGLLVFSDIPNDRLLKFDESSGKVSVLRQPSRYANGNTRDREGRLVTCSEDARAVVRAEHDGNTTILVSEYEGKKLNGPDDIVVKSDGTIWFTDPGYGLGSFYESNHQTGEEGPRAVYRYDPRDGALKVVSTDQSRPNGLAFSPDEKTLYITNSAVSDGPDQPSEIVAYDVADDGGLNNRRVLIDIKGAVPQAEQTASRPPDRRATVREAAASLKDGGAGYFKYAIADGIRVDADGNVWAGVGWAGPASEGVLAVAPDGAPIGWIAMPETVANLAFGGAKRNRLFMAASTSLYSLHLNVQGAQIG